MPPVQMEFSLQAHSAKAAELIVRPELHAAVDWWAQQLLGIPDHDAGDAMTDAVISLAATEKVTPISTHHIQRFRSALLCLLAGMFADNWRKDQPNWGSYLRCIHVDYGPSEALRAALDFSGIDNGELRLPIKTCMWVNPN
jgi:hypothetical protein